MASPGGARPSLALVCAAAFSRATRRAGQGYHGLVAGGAGKHSAVIPTFGATRSVTRRIAD